MFLTAAPTTVPSVDPTVQPVTSIPSGFPTITGAVVSVSMSGAVTTGLTQEALSDIADDLAGVYGVDVDEIELTTMYVATGTLDVAIPDDVPEEEALAAIEEALAESLGVHVSDVVVTLGDNGVVSYQISGSSYEDVAVLQELASESEFVNSLNDDLVEKEIGISVSSIAADPAIEVVISATVDATTATPVDNPEIAVASLTTAYGLSNSNVENVFITAAPTFVPSVSPVTSVPTGVPSITGLIVSVEVGRATTEALSNEEVSELVDTVAEAYGVNVADVHTDIEYVTSGSLAISIPDDLSIEEAESIVAEMLSNTLGVPSDSITVSVDPTSGLVTYSIAVDDYETSEELQGVLSQANVVDLLNEQADGLQVQEVVPDPEIVATVVLVVDADEVSVPLQQGDNVLSVLLPSEYTLTTEGKPFLTSVRFLSTICDVCA